MRGALTELPGVAKVSIDFEGRTATCKVDAAKFNAEGAVKELANAGFEGSTIAN